VLAGVRGDMPDLFAAMDVFTLPSYREGMPRTIIEAMHMARAVVATDIRGSREEVVPEVTGLLVPTRDARALEQAFLRLLRDAALRERMGTAGRERAVQLYDEALVVQKQIASIRAHLPPALRAREAGP
jgi:glycosyltransferase involved in cell wall biosynthesis